MKQSDKIIPLLMCPSCNEGMGEVNHNNLQIDVDPKCRGVWLDRGELETLWKLVEQVDAEMRMRATISTFTAIKYTDSSIYDDRIIVSVIARLVVFSHSWTHSSLVGCRLSPWIATDRQAQGERHKGPPLVVGDF